MRDALDRAGRRIDYGAPCTPGFQGERHSKVWRKGGEMRECDTSGCSIRFTPLDVCSGCGHKTLPLQTGDA